MVGLNGKRWPGCRKDEPLVSSAFLFMGEKEVMLSDPVVLIQKQIY